MSPVSVNEAEYDEVVGVDKLYIAEVTQDDASGYVADTPEYLAPTAEISGTLNQSMEAHYYDNKARTVIYSAGEKTLTIKVSGIPPAMLAKLTGRTFDAATGRFFDLGGIPPNIALSFRSEKSNGNHQYFQFLKGKFSMPKKDAATKKERADVKIAELEYMAVRTIYEYTVGTDTGGALEVMGDEDTDNFSGTSWYTQVQQPGTTAPSALALSSSDPVDGATGVVVSISPTLTFNNALIPNAVYNVVLIKASDGITVAGTYTLDTTKKIMTINPTVDLTAATAYIITYAVIDIYGQTLKGAVNFQTA